ncbi:D-alanine--D-serine ligase VanG [Paenibacillus radicis (ex Gao et al. 2016)]|uniref:D-alanine--D-alanine ligase n=1 Tax=Paenibacillus radicis (ex Gao et al. 2016) TaxID=1737354 RepID=A0A917LS66_9BACL|nr:D-alanine--D-serine ligase VanG [Paenibacillus radicis (ex Gao et al. 2016)]GGG54394.1 D-alanine--D-alanine ligase [Paenibacillus radicis (ex Gao et al. 2016)]
MTKTTVAIVFGGCSTEYEVSLSSASAVIEHLNIEVYDIVMIGISREGNWYRYRGETALIREDRWLDHPSCVPAVISPSRHHKGLLELVGTEHRFTPLDIVFPVLHGKNGEDGTIQGLLELSGIPFVGCGTLSSALCMDKAFAKTVALAAGIDVPDFVTVIPGMTVAEAVAAASKLGYPLYVKPARSGSSIGISKAYTEQELAAGIEEALRHDSKLVIERHVDGIELGCAILGHADAGLIAGEIDEIALTGEFFDYVEKYSLSTAAIHLPSRVDAEMKELVKATALRIYRELDCSGFARVDLFLANDGRLLFNEVNTIPGFTSKSRYPNMMRHAGIDFPDLLDRLIESGLKEARV